MKDDLLVKWKDIRISAKVQVKEALEFDYDAKSQKKKYLIIEALAFWRFVFDYLPWNGKNLNYVGWMKRQESLSVFADDVNPYIMLIATLESLPTAVLRKVLWRYNIDFMSFESFLRRISEKEAVAIRQNYADLYMAQRIPRAYGASDRLFGKISIESIFSEDFIGRERYENKGAMSYNLLGLDFGFNAYPNGIKDDMKLIEVSPLRFISDKNHADDFVVNQGVGGKYWWLYRTARSNYLWRSGRHVELNSHICPGFWLTLFVHLMFWVISPLLMATITTSFLNSVPWWVGLPIVATAFFTPFCLFIAMLKWIAKSDSLSKFGEFRRRHERVFDWIETAGAGAVLLVILLVVLTAFAGATMALYYFFQPAYGGHLSAMIILAFYAYLGYKIYSKRIWGATRKFLDYPDYLRYPVIGAVFIALMKAAYMHRQAILNWLSLFIMEMGPMALMLLLPCIPAFVLFYITGLEEEKQAKAYDKLSKVLAYVAIVVTIMMLGMAVLVSVHISVLGVSYLYLCAVIALILAGEWAAIWAISPNTKHSLLAVKMVNEHIECNHGAPNIRRRWLLQNRWFLSLSNKDKEATLKRAAELVLKTFHWKFRNKALQSLIPVMNEGLLDLLESNCSFLYSLERRVAFETLKLMCKGVEINEAVINAKVIAEQEEFKAERRKELWRKTKLVMKYVFFPIIIASKIAEYAKTLYRLYELFNKKCPYVTQKATLEFR